jgi:uncharacterized membrane protein
LDEEGWKMDFTPLTEAPLAIKLHVAFVLPALVLGPVNLFRTRRDRWHKRIGRVWVVSMLGLALSSMFIHTIRLIGPFSPIHILSILTFVGVFRAIWAVRRGDVQSHRRIMRALYAIALLGAGVFTFLPGRRMNLLFAGAEPLLVFAVAALLGVLGVWAVFRGQAGAGVLTGR